MLELATLPFTYTNLEILVNLVNRVSLPGVELTGGLKMASLMESALFVEGDLDRSSAILLASNGVALWVISSSFSGKFSTPFSVSSNSGSPVNNV